MKIIGLALREMMKEFKDKHCKMILDQMGYAIRLSEPMEPEDTKIKDATAYPLKRDPKTGRMMKAERS